MTYKEKIRWLQRYQTALQQERFLQEELERLQSDAERVTACLNALPGGGPNPEKLQRAVERLDAAREKCALQVEKSVELRAKIGTAIATVEDLTGRDVLSRRYLHGQSFGEIGEALGVVLRRIYQVHRMALDNLRVPEETEMQNEVQEVAK